MIMKKVVVELKSNHNTSVCFNHEKSLFFSILIFMNHRNIMLPSDDHEKKFYNLDARS